MSSHVAPCGHPGEAIFGNFVLCRICDRPKTSPDVPALPIEYLTLVIYDGAMPESLAVHNHRSCVLLRTQLQGVARNGQGTFTATATPIMGGEAIYFRVEDTRRVATLQGTVSRPGDGGDMILDSTVLTLGQDVTLTLAITLDPTTRQPAPTSAVHGPFQISSTGTLPGGLIAGVDYWSDVMPPSLDRLAVSPADAAAGVFVALTAFSTGVVGYTHTYTTP